MVRGAVEKKRCFEDETGGAAVLLLPCKVPGPLTTHETYVEWIGSASRVSLSLRERRWSPIVVPNLGLY